MNLIWILSQTIKNYETIVETWYLIGFKHF